MDHDDAMVQSLVNLKRHMGSCLTCITSKKTNDPYDMCVVGIRLAVRLAHVSDNLIRMRREAFASGEQHVIPCPDPRKHGDAYATTVLPMVVTGIQDRLF